MHQAIPLYDAGTSFDLSLGARGLLLVCLLLAAWLGIRVVRRLAQGSKQFQWSPVTLLGITAIVAGLVLFGSRHASFVEVRQADSSKIAQDDDFDPRPDGGWDSRPLWPASAVSPASEVRRLPSWWTLVGLGTALIIAGSLLAGRERTRPATLKAFTVLGVAAIVFSVASFFGSPPRLTPPGDQVIRVAKAPARPAGRTSPVSSEAAAPDAAAGTPIRPGRARRPQRRPDRPGPSTELLDQLPPRAGQIPVATELAESAGPATTESTTTGPATTEPSTTGPAEPATAAPPAAAPQPATPQPAAPPRPAWVDAPPKLNGSIYPISVKSGLFVSVPECQRELDAAIQRISNQYIDEYLRDLGEHASALVRVPLDYLTKHVKKAEYDEVVLSETVGPMHQIHALLEFDDAARADFHRRWHRAVVTSRLWYAGSGAALVLALLATFYGYLKLDLRTAGAHKSALQLAATLVALIVAAGALLLRSAVQF